jgi:hypothetical protein
LSAVLHTVHGMFKVKSGTPEHVFAPRQ